VRRREKRCEKGVRRCEKGVRRCEKRWELASRRTWLRVKERTRERARSGLLRETVCSPIKSSSDGTSQPGRQVSATKAFAWATR